MKIILIVVAIVGGLMWWGSLEQKRVAALDPAARYEERCQNSADAVVMAQQVLRDRLNIADYPKFETWGFDKLVQKVRGADSECIFVIADHFTFKNEMGGTSRRHAMVRIAPHRTEPERWMIKDVRLR